MNKKSALHVVILFTATLITFFWVTDESLSYYSLQLTGILLLTLIITHHVLKPASFKLVESTVSTLAVLLVTEATGGISSPLFFLAFFLLFELSLLLEPIIPLFLSGAFILFYLFTAQVNQTGLNWLALLAFPTMTPLAYFLGKIYRKEENQKKEIRNLQNKVETLKEELVQEEIGKNII